MRLAAPVFVFNNDTETHLAIHLIDSAEDPNAWIVHLNDDVRPLGNVQPQHVDRRWRRDPIAIQGNDSEPMARQRQGGPHACAGIEQPEKNTLPLFHANWISVSEHPVAESGRVIHDLKPIIGRRSFANIFAC